MEKFPAKIIIRIILILFAYSCEKEIPQAPSNLRYGDLPRGSVVGVYDYSNGILTGMSLYLSWDSVVIVDGYNLYCKTSKSLYELMETTERNHIWISQGVGTKTYAVTAFNKDGESGYSNELDIIVKR